MCYKRRTQSDLGALHRGRKPPHSSQDTGTAAGDAKNTLKVANGSGKSQEQVLASLTLSSVAPNANTARAYAHGTMGDLDLTETVGVMAEKVGAVQRGDLSGLEATLTAQATALDAIFNEMARRAALNMGDHLNATEVYMRMALKAQAQCRSTIETLAEIKNPRPIAFVRQANIAAGPQQVNNGVAIASAAPIDARAGEPTGDANELLGLSHEQRLDSGTAGAAVGAGAELEAVGGLNRSDV